ncbi:hypothetical protein EJB05_09634 [Eragrostis curvula]|uniref:Uncharacterized protein n=1 Tax=Eragrostis curvula TaxID=38414 RepID=A0A5J9W4A8_9POAL|nr:hypothetical protein EJB05_09634 [Eragrostis curvula]
MTELDSPTVPHYRTEIRAVGAQLGCVTVTGSRLYIWSVKAGREEGDMVWSQRKVIDFESLVKHGIVPHEVVCFADGSGAACVGTDEQVFVADLKTGRCRKVQGVSGHDRILPFMRLYTPDMHITSGLSFDMLHKTENNGQAGSTTT